MSYMLAATLVVTLLAFTGIWLIHVKSRDAGYVDFYWGPGFAVMALMHGADSGFTAASAILTAAVLIWAARLSAYLVGRHKKSNSEDGRYAAMREAGGAAYWWKSLFSVFLLQGLLQWVIAAPVHAVFTQSHFGATGWPLFVSGLILFAAGMWIEWTADSQLAAFKSQPAPSGGLLTTGIWSACRHPNYLGEMILWSGIGLSAFAATQSPFAFLGPLVLTVTMRFVSIPLTEEHLQKTRPLYAAYMARTPMLIPRLSAFRSAAVS